MIFGKYTMNRRAFELNRHVFDLNRHACSLQNKSVGNGHVRSDKNKKYKRSQNELSQ